MAIGAGAAKLAARGLGFAWLQPWRGAGRCHAHTQAGPLTKFMLKPNRVGLFQKHRTPLVYDGAIASTKGRVPRQGDAVLVCNPSGKPFAWGMYNPESLYRIRVMDYEETLEAVQRDPAAAVRQLLEIKFRQAVGLRRALGLPGPETDVFRLVNGEGDGLSGLVVDVLASRAVVAPSAAWYLYHKRAVLDTLSTVLPELAASSSTGTAMDLHWRPAAPMLLKEEGCPAHLVTGTKPQGVEEEAHGNQGVEEDAHGAQDGKNLEAHRLSENTSKLQALMVTELGLQYPLETDGPNQKTGFYADQRDSRAFLRGISRGKRVLDLCCYTGGFALNAAAGGAVGVLGVDSSAAAVDAARAAAELNGLAAVSLFERADVRAWAATQPAESWDVVVLDPPKLARGRAGLHRAQSQYLALNTAALRLVARGGLLMTCTCSGSMTQSGGFVPMLQEAARVTGRSIRVLRIAGAAADHPVAPEHGEGAYLTNVLVHVV